MKAVTNVWQLSVRHVEHHPARVTASVAFAIFETPIGDVSGQKRDFGAARRLADKTSKPLTDIGEFLIVAPIGAGGDIFVTFLKLTA